MRELRGDLRLLEEARQTVGLERRAVRRLARHLPEHHLHGEAAPQVLVAHLEDRAHAATRDLAAHGVPAAAAAGRGHTRGFVEVDGGIDGIAVRAADRVHRRLGTERFLLAQRLVLGPVLAFVAWFAHVARSRG